MNTSEEYNQFLEEISETIRNEADLTPWLEFRFYLHGYVHGRFHPHYNPLYGKLNANGYQELYDKGFIDGQGDRGLYGGV